MSIKFAIVNTEVEVAEILNQFPKEKIAGVVHNGESYVIFIYV